MDKVKAWIERHPRLSAWLALSVGMLIILFVTSWREALLPFQRLAMAGATVLVAGLCVWIAYWE